MTARVKDGGPAMPFEDGMFVNGKRANGSAGMTLRDYFAAKAMQGMIDSKIAMPRLADMALIAGAAYDMADAMLAARGARQGLAASGECTRTAGCVCGGDTERVRRGCGYWQEVQS